MSCVWGKNITVSIFGESHGSAIGAVIGGLPPGHLLDTDQIAMEMARRAPGQGELSTPRRESDAPAILSGVFEGRTTGAPLCATIENRDTRSRDYSPEILRPGHADYPAYCKYKGFADYRGGGHFSGRLTASLVFAGAIAKQILAQRGVRIGARIHSIAGIDDGPANPPQVISASAKPFPVWVDHSGNAMRQAILDAKAQGDSVGGVVECVALGLTAGWGSPYFRSAESVLSSMLFSIPAVKGVEFGEGFAMGGLRGSDVNDPLRVVDGEIQLASNSSGGINGGITNGAPLVLRAVIRPTPTIAAEQRTVNTKTMENTTLQAVGRHDPCIVPRAVPVVEAGVALCLLDLMMEAQ